MTIFHDVIRYLVSLIEVKPVSRARLHVFFCSSVRFQVNNLCNYSTFVSHVEPKNITVTLTDENCLLAIQEELNQIKRNEYMILFHVLKIKHS